MYAFALHGEIDMSVSESLFVFPTPTVQGASAWSFLKPFFYEVGRNFRTLCLEVNLRSRFRENFHGAFFFYFHAHGF
jgi:hypothetical protein